MRDTEQKAAARAFAEYWKDKGYEKGETQPFWISLLRDVLGVEQPEKYIKFEEQVQLGHTSFIDAYIPETHVLIEQKSIGKDLRKAIPQSDGTKLSPFQQAQRYSATLPYSQRPRWVVTCNFAEFLIYDMEKPNGEPESIKLCELEKEYYRLQFLVKTQSELLKKEEDISVEAGKIVGNLYDELLKQYINPENEQTLKSLNQLCVRLVFCLYAEDAGIFNGHTKFHDYIKSFEIKDVRRALIDLFKILNTKENDRDRYLDKQLLEFPYVNGGLFADENIEIPQFNEKIVKIILERASEDFNWSAISPTIFGAVFESTLNPETRRSGGMHYTSIENIHKVIDPLFLDGLREELDKIKEITVEKTRLAELEKFRTKLSQLTFLDPACGSGNFLTETYISLRRLENEALKISTNQITLDTDIIQVSIGQFYGIEINDFAVTVAKTALWIAESQMMKETEEIVHMSLDFLPLKTYANIVEGNALRMDWNDVIPKEQLNYIMGNPPFVGARLMSAPQKEDLMNVFGQKWKNAGNLDYVACWYKKAAEMMCETPSVNFVDSSLCEGACYVSLHEGGGTSKDVTEGVVGAKCVRPNIRTALVSTNSICQGEQVSILWKPLFERFGIQIDFAHRTFRWDSEASAKAHVHCVIVGFSVNENSLSLASLDSSLKEGACYASLRGRGGTSKDVTERVTPSVSLRSTAPSKREPVMPPSMREVAAVRQTEGVKFIYTSDRPMRAENINAYLLDAPNVFIEKRKKPICDVDEIVFGNMPNDGGYLSDFSDDDKNAVIAAYPEAEQCFKQFFGATEFLNNKLRWCLWLKNINPILIKKISPIYNAVNNVYKIRSESNRDATKKLADTPALFGEIRQPDTEYIIVPRHSSESRKYIPIGFVSPQIICGDANFIIPNATLYHFGVLTSNVHNAWIRAVCGRLEMRYRYSKDIVYNNFPWCDPTDEQKAKIEQTAQAILDARALYPDCSLADLYDELTMPPELRKAHQANDRAVMQAYGFPVKNDFTESMCVEELMKMYQELTE